MLLRCCQAWILQVHAQLTTSASASVSVSQPLLSPSKSAALPREAAALVGTDS